MILSPNVRMDRMLVNAPVKRKWSARQTCINSGSLITAASKAINPFPGAAVRASPRTTDCSTVASHPCGARTHLAPRLVTYL
jgi:hypothetical protein